MEMHQYPQNQRGALGEVFNNSPPPPAQSPSDLSEQSQSQGVGIPPRKLSDVDLSNYTQTSYSHRRDLTWGDVAALNINKMIGTGIYTTPGIVLALTQNKTVALMLWIVGGVYSFVCVAVYIEYGYHLPFTGGELIYLDEVYKRKGYELLATVLFSVYMILLGFTAGNAVAFSKHIVLSMTSGIELPESVEGRFVSLVAVGILAFVCLLHYFSRNWGLRFNRLFAAFKIIFLTVLIVAGAHTFRTGSPELKDGVPTGRGGRESGDWNNMPGRKASASLSAFIYILYSYRGWENANYVGGEIVTKGVDGNALRVGSLVSVGVVSILYSVVTAIYYAVLPFKRITEGKSDMFVVQEFAPLVFGLGRDAATEKLSAVIALSALGNLIAVIYTLSRVKQQIGRTRTMPFFNYFNSDCDRYQTPKGALFLHFLVTSIAVVSVPTTSDGYYFLIGLFNYGEHMIGVFVGVGLAIYKRESIKYETWNPKLLVTNWLFWPIVTIFIGMNGLILYSAAAREGEIPRWLWPATCGGVFVLGLGYFTVLKAWMNWSKRRQSSGISHNPKETILGFIPTSLIPTVRLRFAPGNETIQETDSDETKQEKFLSNEASKKGITKILIYDYHFTDKQEDWIKRRVQWWRNLDHYLFH